MNIYILVIMIIAAFGILGFMYLPMLYFLIGGFGVMIGVGPTLIIIYIMAPRMYYYKFRLFEDRAAGAYVEKDVRARRITAKDGYEYLETPSGDRFRFHDLEGFFSGTKGQLFGDFFRVAGQGKESQIHPIQFDLENVNEARKKIIPVDQRAWFSNNRVIGAIKEATKIPTDVKLQMLTTFGFIGAVLLIAIVLIFYPMFLEETTAQLRADAAGKIAIYNSLLKSLDEHKPVLCQYELIVPETPEPEPEPAPVPPPS